MLGRAIAKPNLQTLLLSVDSGYPQGAPLQVNFVGVPLVGTL
jgi:hypothetical protein